MHAKKEWRKEMIAKFDYHEPKTLIEACELKKEFGQNGIVVAGGSDVYAKMHDGNHHYDHVIDIKKIPEMQGIYWSEKDGLSIGAAVTLHEIERHPIINEKYQVLVQGVRTIGSLQVRNRGTIGGNICTAAPSADSAGPLLVLNAECVIQGIDGQRIVPISKFFTGPKKTVINQDEVLVQIRLKNTVAKFGGAYFKYGRRNAMEIALLNISVYLEVDKDNKTCTEMRIALGTSAPTPIRISKTEQFFIGKDLSNKEILNEGGKLVLEEASPRSSWRAESSFRLKLLQQLVPRTVKMAYKNLIEEI
jgi:CO/xanthine dehydrogenase FAD-binding subunit